MIGRSRKPPAASKKPRPSQRDKKHVDELLDEALEETFPASDPPAMLEPLPDSPPADEDDHGCLQPRHEAMTTTTDQLQSGARGPCRSGW
jgi:hypothetical protein